MKKFKTILLIITINIISCNLYNPNDIEDIQLTAFEYFLGNSSREIDNGSSVFISIFTDQKDKIQQKEFDPSDEVCQKLRSRLYNIKKISDYSNSETTEGSKISVADTLYKVKGNNTVSIVASITDGTTQERSYILTMEYTNSEWIVVSKVSLL